MEPPAPKNGAGGVETSAGGMEKWCSILERRGEMNRRRREDRGKRRAARPAFKQGGRREGRGNYLTSMRRESVM